MSYKGAEVEFKKRWSIEEKLVRVNALNVKTAATAEEADLSFSERSWLLYLTGGMTSKIRKTVGNRYYLRETK